MEPEEIKKDPLQKIVDKGLDWLVKSIKAILIIVTTASAVIFAVWGIIDGYVARDKAAKKEAAEQQLVDFKAAVSDIVVTKEEFQNYIDSEALRHKATSDFMVATATGIDSTLILILPSIANSQASLERRLALIENKFSDKNPDGEYSKIWNYLQEKDRTDSSNKMQIQIIDQLNKMNRGRLEVITGDRVK